MSESEWEDASGTSAEEPAPVETFYRDCYEWVDDWMLPRYRRKPNQTRWDPRWFENLEAVDRIESLWRAWEYYRLQGMTGMATYWLNVLDPMLRELTSPEGVFWYIKEYSDPDDAPVPVTQMQSDPVPEEARW